MKAPFFYLLLWLDAKKWSTDANKPETSFKKKPQAQSDNTDR